MSSEPVPEAAGTVDTTTSGVPAAALPVLKASLLKRLWRGLGEEFAGLHLRLLVIQMAVALLPYHAFPRLRTALYRLAGISIGRGTLVLGRLQLSGHRHIAKQLRIGSHCVINAPLYLDLTGPITIGDHIHVGHHSVMVTADHEVGSPSRRGGRVVPRAVHIEDGCMIGARVTILPGVTVSRHSIVGPGSLVAATVPANKLAAGVPARVIKSLPEENP